MKIKAITLILLLLFLLAVQAQTANLDLAYSWLTQQPTDNVFSASLVALAVSKADSTATQTYKDFIVNLKDPSQACWPAGNCNAQDTSMALLVESKLGLGSASVSAEDIISWLTQEQSLAPLSGIWNLQIVTEDTGTCTITYTKQGEAKSSPIDLNVDKGKISYGSCQDQYFFNLNTCLGTSVLSKPSTQIEVSCQSLTDSEISILYFEGNSIYLLGSPISTRAMFKINNGWFGDKISTLYANWALSEAGSDINSLIYLKKNAVITTLDQAVLYMITNDQSYLNQLLSLQNLNLGYFQDPGSAPSEFNTGLASFALQSAGQYASARDVARTWLDGEQREDGSWANGDVESTAMVLYGAYEGGSISISNGVTPTGNCILSNPRWLNLNLGSITSAIGSADIPSGDTVLLAVDGATGCANQQITFEIFEDETGTDLLQETLGPVLFNAQEGLASVEWQPAWFDDDTLSTTFTDDPEYFFKAESGSGQISPSSPFLEVTPPLETQCSDGLDNDADGLIDFPADLGCLGFVDNVEDNSKLACADGWDNDGDGLFDLADPGCISEADSNEVDGSCTPDWECDQVWSICSSTGVQIRDCRDNNGCGLDCPENDQSCIEERDCIGNNVTGFEPPDSGLDTDEDELDQTPSTQTVCVENDLCEYEYGEDEFNCPADCTPTTQETTGTTDSGFPPLDEEEQVPPGGEQKSQTIWIILIILILILIVAAAYFFIFKKQKGQGLSKTKSSFPTRPERPSFMEPQMPTSPTRQVPQRTRTTKTKLEEDLEKSLREAKKLLEK